MTHLKALFIISALSLFFSCQKNFSNAEKQADKSLSQTQANAATSGDMKYERFDGLPLDLNWVTNEYKPNANAFKIVQDAPAAGPGTAKFILYPDAIIAGRNRSQLTYQPLHALGSESAYELYLKVPSYWPDNAGNNDVTLFAWNASPDPAKGENWSNMPVNEALAYVRYHAEGGRSYLQLFQGLNASVPYDGKIWTIKYIGQVAITKNTWLKLNINIKWSTAADGYFNASVNGQQWASQTAVRTMANSIPAYFKIGLSRLVPANIPENVTSIFFDEVKIGLKEQQDTLTHKTIAQNLKNPWDVVWGPDNYIWFTERAGSISRLNPVTGVVNKLLTLPDIMQAGTGGLLGMVLHPQFLQQPYLFAAYNSTLVGRLVQKVVRYTYLNGALVNPVIIVNGINVDAVEHHGCRLAISGNYLFITTGDGGGGRDKNAAQNKTSLSGKVLRVNLNGGIPSDNPIAKSGVWSWGFRNSQGLVFANNKLYATEHGPESDDELNIIEPGRNYGWPTVWGYCDKSAEQSFCNAQNVKQPLMAWTPTIAPSGLDYYNNAGPITEWRNSLLMCTLKGSRLIQLKLNADGSAITSTKDFFINTYGRLRDVCVSPQGKVYICTDNGTNDKIVEIGQ